VNEARYHCANRPSSDAHHISPTIVQRGKPIGILRRACL